MKCSSVYCPSYTIILPLFSPICILSALTALYYLCSQLLSYSFLSSHSSPYSIFSSWSRCGNASGRDDDAREGEGDEEREEVEQEEAGKIDIKLSSYKKVSTFLVSTCNVCCRIMNMLAIISTVCLLLLTYFATFFLSHFLSIFSSWSSFSPLALHLYLLLFICFSLPLLFLFILIFSSLYPPHPLPLHPYLLLFIPSSFFYSPPSSFYLSWLSSLEIYGKNWLTNCQGNQWCGVCYICPADPRSLSRSESPKPWGPSPGHIR